MEKKGLKPSHIARTLAPAVIIGLAGGMAFAQTPSAEKEICGDYVVTRGDTLRKIGRQFYERDERNDWKIIFDANRDTIGRSPHLIEIGMELEVPCLPGQSPEPAAELETQAQSGTVPEIDEAPQSTDIEAQGPLVAPVVSVLTSIAAPTLVLEGNFQPAPSDVPEDDAIVVTVTQETEAAPGPAQDDAEQLPPLAKDRSAELETVDVASKDVPTAGEEAQIVDLVSSSETTILVEGFTTSETEKAAVAPSETQPDDQPLPITLVTGNGYAPFTDESLPGRGFFTLLVQTAMLRAEPERPYTIKFVNDWDAHLDALMPSLAFDASFPWAEPDCLQMGLLSDDEQNRCMTYKFSDPFYEVVDGFFTRKGSGFEEATDYSEFAGTVICRPEGYTRSHLDLVGMVAPLVTYVSPVEVAECFEMLMRADVDMVSIESQVADDTIAKMGLRDDVVQNPNLAALRPLTLIVHKENAHGDEFLSMLNEGLRIMRDSGEWYAITSRALMQQAEAES